ncbi:tRNA preQ1(34) S-adenosylmethionine ribosyltransferase-isomerase QueA [Patescibacteria group bacterium]|nr:tRNA preQ1(34) S-adenosylmethionine ribosyltransferase-isomerase QueA [Patescibacteria group bacterium]
MLSLNDFNYHLLKNCIAQRPASPRDSSKLLVLDKRTGAITHSSFLHLDSFLQKGDVLIFNNSAVFPARLYGKKKKTGGKAEVLLLKNIQGSQWECLARPGIPVGTTVVFSKTLQAKVIKICAGGKKRVIEFLASRKKVWQEIERIGAIPTPPYITEKLKKKSQYQTIYADVSKKGSAAAPTAGLHFTKRLLKKLKKGGVTTCYVTLHVGLGTFEPVSEKNITKHVMHSEWYSIDTKTLSTIKKAKKEGRRIIAVGTTSARVLETVFSQKKPHLAGETSIFIYPPYTFKALDGLITNFHLPKSTLLMLVSALTSREKMLHAYNEAINHGYRFYSFGDGMLIQ